MEKKFRLCYVGGNVMYFTDNFEHQWGDDWDDAPYDCNAEEPYEWIDEWPAEENIKNGHGHIRYIAYRPDWKVSTLNDGCLDSPFSVKEINKGDIAWLRHRDMKGLMAGATMEEAIKWLKKANLKFGEIK